MKKTPQYAQKLKKLFGVLKKGIDKPKKSPYEDLIETMVFASLCQDSTEAAARNALKKIQSHFVDFNDLRVARTEEILEVIGSDMNNAEKSAANTVAMLNAVFQKYDSLISENIAGTGKKGIKEALEKISGLTDFVKNFVYLTFVNIHAVPLTRTMIEYFKKYELVDPQWDDKQIAAFLEKQVSASDALAFYAAIRHDSEAANPKAAQILAEEKKSSKTKT